jgi:nitroreductase
MTRQFAGGPSEDEVYALCAEALRAPSAGFSQGTHLLILTGPNVEDFWSASGAEKWFTQRSPGVLEATAVILILGDRQSYLERYTEPDKAELGLADPDAWAVPYWLTDAAMVAQNLLLLAEERRWGALFFGLTRDQGAYLQSLNVPESASCIGAIALGYRSAQDRVSGSPRSRSRHPSQDHLHRGNW